MGWAQCGVEPLAAWKVERANDLTPCLTLTSGLVVLNDDALSIFGRMAEGFRHGAAEGSPNRVTNKLGSVFLTDLKNKCLLCASN